MSNKLVYAGREYTDKNIASEILVNANAFIGDSLSSASLPIDTFSASVFSRNIDANIASADGVLIGEGENIVFAQTEKRGLDTSAKYGEPVQYYHDGVLIGDFRLENVVRNSKYGYTLSCVSAIGLLLTENHYGGLYTGETAGTVIADVIGSAVDYTIDASLQSVPIYGWLKKATRRDNLRDVLFAIGGQIRKDTVGKINIVPMESKEPYKISADEFYVGGSVTRGNPATGVLVTEHSFVKLQSDETVVLYEGESAAEKIVTPKGKTVSGVLVDFQEPMHDLIIENATILESGANYAVISGSPAVILKGQKYTHTQRVISRLQSSNKTQNILTSSDCTLVNLMNSELVADRLMAYYGYGKIVEADLVVKNNRPGDSVTFTDPFGDESTGFISEMELTMSGIIKAKTTIVTGFIPAASGNYYSNLTEFTENGTYTAKKDGKIRVVVIGGGDGGECGKNGENGENGSSNASGSPGIGGEPGSGGNPGKIFVVTVPVKRGQTFPVTVGDGGTGAQFGGLPGVGFASTFGNYSSEDGYRSDAGHSALIGGNVYGVKGGSGIKGGDGQPVDVVTPGNQTEVSFQGQTWYSGTAGETVSSSGAGAAGGLGGGAAVGLHGQDGSQGEITDISSGILANGGDGGSGATPIKAPNGVVRGSGGTGGHGGGGGGGGGAAAGGSENWVGNGGAGGSGGAGGDGAKGIVLVYD